MQCRHEEPARPYALPNRREQGSVQEVAIHDQIVGVAGDRERRRIGLEVGDMRLHAVAAAVALRVRQQQRDAGLRAVDGIDAPSSLREPDRVPAGAARQVKRAPGGRTGDGGGKRRGRRT